MSVADLSKIDPQLAGKLARYSKDGELDFEDLERRGLLNSSEVAAMRMAAPSAPDRSSVPLTELF